MASINKIEIKQQQYTVDEDGNIKITGIVTYKGNILGRWTRNGANDSNEYEFDKDILRNEAKKAAEAEFNFTGTQRYFSVDQLLLKIAELNQKEEAYIKGRSLGYSTFVCADDHENEKCIWYCDKTPLDNIKESEEYHDFLKQVKRELSPTFRERLIMITDNLDDFNIVV